MGKIIKTLVILVGISFALNLQAGSLAITNEQSVNASSTILTYTQKKDAPSPLENKNLEFKKQPRGILYAINGFEAYWLKFTIENKNNAPLSRFLDFNDATFTDLIIYELVDGSYSEIYHAGRKYRESIKQFEIAFSKAIDFKPLEARSFLIRVTNNITATTDIYVNDQVEHGLSQARFFFLVFGAQLFMLSLGIYSVFLWLRLRAPVYGFYSLFVLSFVFLTTTNQGVTDSVLYPLTGWIIYDYTPATFFFSGIFAVLYTSSFLNIKSDDRPLYYLFSFILAANIIGFLLVFMGINNPSARDLLNLVSATLFIVASVRSIKRGFRPAKVFFLGYGCFCIGVLFYIGANSGAIERTYFTKYGGLWGAMIEVIIMSIALADRIKLQREQKSNLAEEKKSNQALHKLIQVLCHDIANPLTVIKSLSKIRKEKSDAPEDKKVFEKIFRCANDINEIIVDVRAIESQNSGNLKPILKPICLEEVVKKSIETFTERIRNKSIRVDLLLPQGDNTLIMASSSPLKSSVINNVLSNAVKFTPVYGEIAIRIDIIDESLICLKIADSGIGIPPDALENIFDSTRNISRPGTENEQGTGFGMPVMKAYMEAFGGHVNVESNHEKTDDKVTGTSFELIFKRASLRNIN